MKVQTNLSKRALVIVCVIFSLLLIGASCVFISYKMHYKNYVTVNAEIIDIREFDPNKEGVDYVPYYKYDVDGFEAIGTKRIFSKGSRYLGKMEEIRYNPDNPVELEDTYTVNSVLFIVIFLAVFDFGMIFVLIVVSRKAKLK